IWLLTRRRQTVWRQPDHSRRPPTGRAVQDELAAVPRDQRARYVETEAGPLETPRQTAVKLGERLEDALEVLLRDADPGVVDEQAEAVIGVPRSADRNRAARLGELDRVRQQVIEHLLQPPLIGPECRNILRNVRDEHDLGGL